MKVPLLHLNLRERALPTTVRALTCLASTDHGPYLNLSSCLPHDPIPGNLSTKISDSEEAVQLERMKPP